SIRRYCFAILLFFLLGTWATPQNSTPSGTKREDNGSRQKPASPPTSNPAQSSAPDTTQAESKISPQEAEDLFRSVDEILKFASQNTTLPIRETVKKRLVNRDEVVAFIEKHMSEDEDAQRLKRSESVLKKFGLLPRDFN